MPTPISSIVPVTATAPAADAATPGLVLQAGSVVDAQVLSVMADNLVRIAIANLAIDVMSEVPLSPGQTLQLAVSQNEAGVRLAIVNGAGGAAADAVTLTPGAVAVADSAAPAANVARAPQLTPLEQIAVSVAAEAAVTRQGSQAPLFANLAAVVDGSALPPALKQAVLDVLVQQTPLDPRLGGNDIEAAFQKSGLFLEASLASGTAPSGTIPDLKAALLVLRQTLAATSGALPATPVVPQAAVPSQVAAAPQAATAPEQAALKTLAAPSLAPEIEAGPLPLSPRDAAVATAMLADGKIALSAMPRTVAASVALSLLQEATQALPRLAASASVAAKAAVPDAHAGETALRAAATPPPFRGALPSAQPVATAALPPDAPLAQTVHRLLDDTDAAIARQTLLQVASLPDRVDAGGHRIDPTVPQWNFEIPFATPQGTAMAQFEISRDGGGEETDPAKRAWRARFSLNVEPTGPVHALITLSGDKTFVRMWAERPATVAQLRAGVGELSQALTRAELKTGDIVIREGTPPQPAPAKAGHFLDRAL
ncbi:flagellar hook-length control protein FliK [Bradyrhizobium sp.]|uniref:flagellar hook-length control protein FliK n=1 Tax=Bradyrhizobium sp. TaxID=376 RepID=UPI00239C02E8|nr:flagellar hook-length control protein FliK [Bradyrhizobium sp.]MDE2378954.1 flagellar hook-length control protein FliK [Bradyrhizobium sp.]